KMFARYSPSSTAKVITLSGALALVCVLGCTITSVSPKIDPARSMTAPVQAVYAEAAAAAQAGDSKLAGEKYEAALEQARNLGDEAGIGFSLASLGAVNGQLGKFTEAIETLGAAVPYFTRTGNLAAEGLTLVVIGRIY